MPSTRNAAWPPGGGKMGALLRSLDWTRTALGPVDEWHPDLKAATGLMLDAPGPVGIFWGRDHLLLYNDAWGTDLVEGEPLATLGTPMSEVYPQAWPSLEPAVERLLASGEPTQWEGHLLSPGGGEGGTRSTITLALGPIIDDDGVTIGGIVRRSMEAALRESEERYRSLFSSIDEGFCVMQVVFDPDEQDALDVRFVEVNPAFEEQTGFRGAAGRMLRSLAPDLAGSWYQAFGQVALTGEPARFQDQGLALGRWFDVYAFPFGAPEDRTLGVLFHDITDRRRTEVAFRGAARRSRFRARLAEALRGPDGAVDEMKVRSAELLGEHLQVNRAFYADLSEDGAIAHIAADYYRQGAESLVGDYPMADFGTPGPVALRKGHTFVAEDIDQSDETSPEARETHRVRGTAAEVTVPLMRGDHLMGIFSVHQATPRAWSSGEIALIEETAERTWAAVERVRTERALRESERRYRTLFEAMEEGFCVIERVTDAPGNPLDFRYVVANPAFEWQTGFQAPIGRTIREVAEDVPEGWFQTFQDVLETGNSVRFEAELASPGRVLEVKAFRVEDSAGPSVAVIFRDVTDARRTEQALRDSEERLRRLADSMPQLVWTANHAGLVEYYNTRGVDYQGLDYAGDGHWTWKPILHPDDRPPTLEAWHAAVRSGEPYEMEHRVQMKDGSYRWHLTRAEQVLFSGQVQWYGTATDIHELKSADELKDRFLAIASHELRNPVGVIHGMAQQMQRAHARGALSPDRLDTYVDSLLRSSTYLASLIHDLMDVSRLQRGMLSLHRETCSVRGLIDEVGAADNWPARVVREVATDVPPVDVDPNRIQQVISNLVDNALKYSSAPEPVTIRACPAPDEDAVLVEVVDRGIGLPADALEMIFTPFGRADNVGLTPGLGMGLYVAREIIERHGGRLQANSEGEGHGTTMSLWLPTS